MKAIFSTLILLASSAAFAHGNLAQQSHAALTKAIETLQKNEPKETLRRFKSISAELIAYETFAVVVNYTDATQINYVCAEDETVSPVVWNCTKK